MSTSSPSTLRLSLDPQEFPVVQEEHATCAVRVVNTGTQPCELRFKLTGEAAAWSWVTPGTLTVAGGDKGSVKAVFRAPRAPLPPAGPLPFGVEVTTPGSTEALLSVTGMLQVGAYSDVFASIDPAASSGSRSGRHTLLLENRGNAPMTARLEGGSDSDLDVEVEPSTVRADSGERVEATVTARCHQGFRRGPSRSHPFRVVAHLEGAPPVSIGATLRQEATMASWVPRAAVAGAVVLVTAGLAGAAVLGPDDEVGNGVGNGAGDVPGDVAAVDPECPADGHIGSAVHGSAAEGPPAPGYAFLFADDEGCLPARFNPCEPVPYVVNDALAPPGGVEEVHEAIDRVAEATGMTFVDEGTTDEPLDQQRAAYQPERYGERWAPILVGWTELGTGQGPDAAGDDIIVAGRGRPLRVGDVLVSGVLELNADVILNRDTQERLPGGFGEGVTRGRVMLHELGHVVGLGHPGSRAQLMYAELAEHTSNTAQFGVGDRIGLRLVGREAGCLTPPPLPSGS
ncbi:MAG: hypothetical protein H0X58_01725 [Acidimicrobiia bacterium]|nr:hypothetical protein [Acidimicrobiia bacterium]